MSTLFSIHFAATWALVGLIWVVQIVVYPLFLHVGSDAFPGYHARYTRRIALVVGPLMLAELLTALALVATGKTSILFLLSLLPLAFNWVVTWKVQIPLHSRLAEGLDEESTRALTRSNWSRTAAWTLRGLLLILTSISP